MPLHIQAALTATWRDNDLFVGGPQGVWAFSLNAADAILDAATSLDCSSTLVPEKYRASDLAPGRRLFASASNVTSLALDTPRGSTVLFAGMHNGSLVQHVRFSQ